MDENFCDDVKARRFAQRYGVWIFAGAILTTLVGGLVYASQGSPDPTESAAGTSHAVIVANSAVIVFREGLEAVLIFAAVTASMLGAQRGLRRPVAAGAGVAFAATVATWFLAQAILGQFSRYGDQLQAITGLIAIAVLLVIMNWFFHKVYWTKWIGKRNAQRKRVLARSAEAGFVSAQVLGLVALGFSSVYREGFEVVLFLQTLQLQAGTGTVLEGVAIGLAATIAVGAAMFFLQQKLPYKRMLVVTGVMLGVVLVVMVGEQVQEMQQAGWIGTTPIDAAFPAWLGTWFAVFPNVEGVAAQALAAAFVLGSYFLAGELRVRRPRRRSRVHARAAADLTTT